MDLIEVNLVQKISYDNLDFGNKLVMLEIRLMCENRGKNLPNESSEASIKQTINCDIKWEVMYSKIGNNSCMAN